MLRLAGWLYGKIADLRNTLYDRGVFRSHSLGAKTISVGNMTTGGTGKTPLVAYVASMLADAGERVCILTRGYARKNPETRVLVSDGKEVLVDARTGGDEPVELARKLIGKAIVVADADRVGAAAWAKEEFGATAFVLDDGFQHRRSKRDLDIVCIDATDPCGGGRVLPAGKLREPLHNLARADAIVITRADLVESIDDIMPRLRSRNANAPVFTARFEVARLTALSDFLDGVITANRSEAARLFAFCALGSPDSFFKSIARKFDVSSVRSFPDHHPYDGDDIQQIEDESRSAGATALVTTAKDAVKLRGLRFEIPCFVAEIDVLVDNASTFRDLITSV